MARTIQRSTDQLPRVTPDRPSGRPHRFGVKLGGLILAASSLVGVGYAIGQGGDSPESEPPPTTAGPLSNPEAPEDILAGITITTPAVESATTPPVASETTVGQEVGLDYELTPAIISQMLSNEALLIYPEDLNPVFEEIIEKQAIVSPYDVAIKTEDYPNPGDDIDLFLRRVSLSMSLAYTHSAGDLAFWHVLVDEPHGRIDPKLKGMVDFSLAAERYRNPTGEFEVHKGYVHFRRLLGGDNTGWSMQSGDLILIDGLRVDGFDGEKIDGEWQLLERETTVESGQIRLRKALIDAIRDDGSQEQIEVWRLVLSD
ncbi:MAG TPA: hypothetical protein VGA08_02535 [Candidatus Saccharimonadales bacterium]